MRRDVVVPSTHCCVYTEVLQEAENSGSLGGTRISDQ